MRHLMSASRFALAAAAMMAVTGSAVAAEGMPLTQGAMLSNSCAACHGTDGMSPGSMPSIGAKSAEFIEQALKDFRDGKRTGTVMSRHATGYTDEEIRQIAEFFGRPQ